MKMRAPRNRTTSCSQEEIVELSRKLLTLSQSRESADIDGKVINQDLFEVVPFLPTGFVDLLVLDPPYNLTKNFNQQIFKSRQSDEYSDWFDQTIRAVKRTLKPDATIYVCSDWRTSTLIFPILERYFHVRNRITWEREKGRGAKSNWKNNTEDIWYCTVGNDYYFDVDAVKVKRKVIAPYRTESRTPKDWEEGSEGNYRLTHPSNIWSDITVPFWSMPENTDHPTQKPEKLMAKLILASCPYNGFVFDPFLGSGTSAVVAKKLGRKFSGVELDKEYCCWAQKRLQIADQDDSIQGYTDGIFWERNSLDSQQKLSSVEQTPPQQGTLL